MLQNLFVPVGVLECHILERDVAADRLPVFCLRGEAVAVALDDGVGVLHVRLGVQQLHQTLDVHLRRDEIRDRVHDPADGLHKPLRIGHEHGEGADLCFGDHAALPEHQREGEGGGEVHRHGEGAAQAGRAHALAVHARGVLHECALHRVLNDERLDRPRAGDALVEVPGNLGVDLADLAVGLRELALEHGEQQHRDRQNRQHVERQPRVDREHHDHSAHDVAELPCAVQQRP